MNDSSSLYSDVTARASNIASDWITPAMSWLGSWFTFPTPTRRSDASHISESLLSELIQQGRILEQRRLQREQEALAESRVVDYSWLVTVKPKQFDITDAERLDLEQVCQQVAPESYSRVVREFRSALLREPAPSDLPAIMRAIVRRVIDEQHNSCLTRSASAGPLLGGISNWLGQSMTNLRNQFGVSMVSVAGAGEDLELSESASSMELGALDEVSV